MPPVQTWKEDRGTFGFHVTADDTQELIRMRFWGIWDDETGVLFETRMMSIFARILPTKPWIVLVDISNYPPQKPSVQQHHANCMHVAKVKIRRSANLVASSLSQMQIRRISEESGLPSYSFFTNEADALRWLQSEEEETAPHRRAR